MHPLPLDASASLKITSISPLLLNSASPWATTSSDLQALYDCPYIGAVTIRTSTLAGFNHSPDVHQYIFHSTSSGHPLTGVNAPVPANANANATATQLDQEDRGSGISSLNTLGYSPIKFDDYLTMLSDLQSSGRLPQRPPKPFILSVAGNVQEVVTMYRKLVCAQTAPTSLSLSLSPSLSPSVSPSPSPSPAPWMMMEINLSCPNIPSKPPPAYCASDLRDYIRAIAREKADMYLEAEKSAGRSFVPFDVQVGIKTPPYTYSAQFESLISALSLDGEEEGEEEEGEEGEEGEDLDSTLENAKTGPGPGVQISNLKCPIAFITATNTLGSSLVLSPEDVHRAETQKPALGSSTGTGIGGLAGSALHPLALGNVKTLRMMLDRSPYQEVRAIKIIGVGGVADRDGFRRMRSVGADLVAVGTALGWKGLGVFEEIGKEEVDAEDGKSGENEVEKYDHVMS